MNRNKYLLLVASITAFVIVVAGLGIVSNMDFRNLEQNNQSPMTNTIVPKNSPPFILSLSSSINPSNISQTVNFSASITQGRNAANYYVDWYINNKLVSDQTPVWNQAGGTNLSTIFYTFNQTGDFKVEVVAGADTGTMSKSLTQVVHGPAPVINSVNSSANPAYVGQTVQFNTQVNWEGYSGSLTYFVNGSQISGSSYIFEKSGNYSVTVKAVDTDGSSSSATYVQQVNPFYILGVSLMTNSTTINTTSAYNNSKIGPNGPGPLNYSLANFRLSACLTYR